MKIHIGNPPDRITSGVVKEISWQILEPYLRKVFQIKDEEIIEEIQPTYNGVRVKIGKKSA